jgi:hypothetical protein
MENINVHNVIKSIVKMELVRIFGELMVKDKIGLLTLMVIKMELEKEQMVL